MDAATPPTGRADTAEVIAELQRSFEAYRVERSANDKLAGEEKERLREAASTATVEAAKLRTELHFMGERYVCVCV